MFSNCDNRRDDTYDDRTEQEEEIQDGAYDATVISSSGTYQVEVEVSNGQVEYVYWPNGGHMSLSGATIVGRHAEGTNSNGEYFEIDI